MEAGDRGDARFTPEAEANRRRQALAYQKSLLDNPEYQQYEQELGEGVMDFSGGLVGAIKKVPSRMATTYKNLPYFDWQANVGRKMKPTEADLTATGIDYIGQDSSLIRPEEMMGGPQYGSLKSSKKDNLMWAGDAKGIGQRYLKGDADLMPVISMAQDAHKSNRSVTNSVFKQLQASIRDGRISQPNLAKLEDLIKSGGSASRIYTSKLLNKAEKHLANGLSPKETAKKLKLSSKNADQELMMRLSLKNMPSLSNKGALTKFLNNATFDTRAKILNVLNSAKAEELGGPNVRKIIRDTLDPDFAGVDKGYGLLMSEIDKQSGLVELGKKGVKLHPSYDYAIKGGNEARFSGPISIKEMFPEFFNRPEIQAMSEADQMYTFKRALPTQEITQEMADRLSSVQSLQNIQSQKQANLVMDFAEGNWATSDALKKDGGISPADFSRALRDSDASPTLTLYTEKEIKAGIKDGSFKVYQLGKQTDGNQVYFGLKKNYSYKNEYGFEHPELTDNEVALVGVVNNEVGAKGVGGPSILLKAIQEGATVLDAYAVPSKKHPSGFLPELYNEYGFVELGRVKFDPQYYTKQEVADLEAYWKSTGWDASMGYPEVAIMKWKGDDAIRSNATANFIEQGTIGSGPEITGFTASTRQADGQSIRTDDGTSQRQSLLNNQRRDSGSIRTGNRTPVPKRISSLLSETVNLTPLQSEVYGLDSSRIKRLGEMYPSLLMP